MLVYLIAFILTILFAHKTATAYKAFCASKVSYAKGNRTFASKQNLRASRIKYFALFFATFLPLFLVSALRYGIGTDYFFTYYPQFYNILNGVGNGYSEWGFYYLNKAIQLFTTDAQWLFVVTGFIFVFVLTKIITNYSKNAFISVLVVLLSGIFFASLNNIRQSIAVIICLAAVPYAIKGQFLKYVLCIIIASLFHITAFLMLLFYLCAQFKFSRKHFLSLAFILTLFLPALCKLFVAVISLTKYKYYFTDNYVNDVTSINIIYHLFFFIAAWIILGKKIKTDKMAYVLLLAQFIAFYVSAASIFIPISELITRLTFYFQVFQILLIPYIYNNIKDKKNKWAFLVVFILLYGAYFVYFYVMNGVNEVLPYRFIFSLK